MVWPLSNVHWFIDHYKRISVHNHSHDEDEPWSLLRKKNWGRRCGHPASKKCQGCLMVRYCSISCQHSVEILIVIIRKKHAAEISCQTWNDAWDSINTLSRIWYSCRLPYLTCRILTLRTGIAIDINAILVIIRGQYRMGGNVRAWQVTVSLWMLTRSRSVDMRAVARMVYRVHIIPGLLLVLSLAMQPCYLKTTRIQTNRWNIV